MFTIQQLYLSQHDFCPKFQVSDRATISSSKNFSELQKNSTLHRKRNFTKINYTHKDISSVIWLEPFKNFSDFPSIGLRSRNSYIRNVTKYSLIQRNFCIYIPRALTDILIQKHRFEWCEKSYTVEKHIQKKSNNKNTKMINYKIQF